MTKQTTSAGPKQNLHRQAWESNHIYLLFTYESDWLCRKSLARKRLIMYRHFPTMKRVVRPLILFIVLCIQVVPLSHDPPFCLFPDLIFVEALNFHKNEIWFSCGNLEFLGIPESKSNVKPKPWDFQSGVTVECQWSPGCPCWMSFFGFPDFRILDGSSLVDEIYIDCLVDEN